MAQPNHFDLIVLGAGPAGYPAAIRAAQAGQKVALIEAQQLGGTCLNRGCIPTKALIANANTLRQIQQAALFGISVGEVSFDYGHMAQAKEAVVDQLRRSLEGLIAANGIQLFRGFGKFRSAREIAVLGPQNALVSAPKVIIATGSEPREIPAFACDGQKIHDSTSILQLSSLPKSLVIIGGGVIGCEFASLYRTFGVEVTILELMPRLLPMECESVSKALTQAFEKAQVRIVTQAQVRAIHSQADTLQIELADGQQLPAEMALVAVGRKMNSDRIGLELAGIATHKDGTIVVDEAMQTNVTGIYAAGDIASRYWLAHVATHQGLVAAQNAMSNDGSVVAKMDYRAIPSVIFTHPEIATVGMNLQRAKEQGYDATVVAYPFSALGKAQATHHTEGFGQIVLERRSGVILGAQIVGFEAGNLIAEMGLAITHELTIAALAETIHAHPTMAEVWLEAALIASEHPLHFAPKKRAKVAQVC